MCTVERAEGRQVVEPSGSWEGRHWWCTRQPVRSPTVSDAAPLNVSAAIEGTTARVTLVGELDLDAAGAVADELGALPGRGAKEIIIDASGLNFLDSSGLRALLSAREQLHQAGATLQISAVSPAVDRVLEITGTRTLLTGG
jgi:stage II sporulation protein AA (anti-sigma F factor antagonist)